jgi:hypothetical protein
MAIGIIAQRVKVSPNITNHKVADAKGVVASDCRPLEPFECRIMFASHKVDVLDPRSSLPCTWANDGLRPQSRIAYRRYYAAGKPMASALPSGKMAATCGSLTGQRVSGIRTFCGPSPGNNPGEPMD